MSKIQDSDSAYMDMVQPPQSLDELLEDLQSRLPEQVNFGWLHRPYELTDEERAEMD